VRAAISVVIPTYNGTSFLPRTLAGVFAQTLPARELVIVDDASSDGTVGLAQSLILQSPVPATVIALPINCGGPAGPFNVGVARACSPYVALCEQDDRMLPRKLEMLSGCVECEPELGMVISRYCVVRSQVGTMQGALADDSSSRFEQIGKRSLGGPYYCLDRAEARRAALDRCYAASLSNMLVRKSVWEQLGGLDESIRAVADHDFLLRLSHDYAIGWVDESLWEFHRHAQSLLARSSLLRCAEDYARIWRKEFSRFNGQHSQVRRLLRQNLYDCAHGHREAGRYMTALRFHARSIRETGLSVTAAAAIAKLLPHYLLRAWRRPPRRTPAFAAQPHRTTAT
jgi:glycosyltransferase involved in cell wall biosynthesis